MTDHVLDRIDAELEAWERGPDAARWAGEPAKDEAPSLHRGGYVNPRFGRLRRHVFADSAMCAALSYSVWRGAMRFEEVERTDHALIMNVSVDMRVVWANVQRLLLGAVVRPPTHAAERTRSQRYRAGSRRTKRHARRQR